MTRFRIVGQRAPSGASSFHLRWLLVAGLLALGFTLATATGRAQGTAPRFNVTNYNINAELFPSTHLLAATARVDLIPKSDLVSLSFELHSNLRVEKVLDATGQALTFRQEGQSLNVSLSEPATLRQARFA